MRRSPRTPRCPGEGTHRRRRCTPGPWSGTPRRARVAVIVHAVAQLARRRAGDGAALGGRRVGGAAHDPEPLAATDAGVADGVEVCVALVDHLIAIIVRRVAALDRRRLALAQHAEAAGAHRRARARANTGDGDRARLAAREAIVDDSVAVVVEPIAALRGGIGRRAAGPSARRGLAGLEAARPDRIHLVARPLLALFGTGSTRARLVIGTQYLPSLTPLVSALHV